MNISKIEVIDGVIGNTEVLWWWGVDGPCEVDFSKEDNSSHEFKNLKDYPKVYSKKEPVFNEYYGVYFLDSEAYITPTEEFDYEGRCGWVKVKDLIPNV